MTDIETTKHDTKLTEDIRAEEHEVTPIEVKIINQSKIEEKNPTSEDTKDIYDFTPSEEEIKEMTDAQ